MSGKSEPPIIDRLVQMKALVEKALLDLGHAHQCAQELGATIVARIQDVTDNPSPELSSLEDQIGELFFLREWHRKFIEVAMDTNIDLTEIFYEWSFLNTEDGLFKKYKQTKILSRASDRIAFAEKLIPNLAKVFNADFSQLTDMPGLREAAIKYSSARNAKKVN